MKLECELKEKTFKDSDGQSHLYYVLSFDLADGSTLELSLKGDKAKLLRLSNKIDDDKKFWEK